MLAQHVPAALGHLQAWVNDLASQLPAPVRAPVGDSDFEWRYAEETAEVVLVAKLVRLVSAMSGAWRLAEAGQSTEAGSLLRLVGDFSSEIWFVSDAILTRNPNRAQRRFIEHFFQPLPRSIEEYLDREKAYWVSRGEIAKVVTRMAREAGADHELHRDISNFISYGLNGYAHGAYSTAMELYHGGINQFVLRGFEEGRVRESSKGFVAAKCTEACLAVGVASTAMERPDMASSIQQFLGEVDPNMG